MALKGAALVSLYYPQRGLRPMQDCDIAVPRSHALKVMAVLRQNRWSSVWEFPPEELVSIRHSASFANGEGHTLDLHWGILWECWNRNSDADFWKRSIRLTIGDQQTCALEPTDQLLQIICHGARWNEVPPIRWIADAVMVLRGPADVDWQRLLRLAEFHHLGLFAHHSLEWLRTRLDAPVPGFVLDKLQSLPVPPIEQFGYNLLTQPPLEAPTNKEIFQTLRYEYLWLTSDFSIIHKPFVFLRWLQLKWRINGHWKTPWVVLSNAAVRIAKQLRTRLARASWLKVTTHLGNGQ